MHQWDRACCLATVLSDTCCLQPYERAVTWEGPDHYSSEDLCSGPVTQMIRSLCNRIVRHMLEVDHQQISRMVLFFKLKRQPDQPCSNTARSTPALPWLLWCGNLSVTSEGVIALSKHSQKINLAPVWVSRAHREERREKDQSEQAMLQVLDEQQYLLSNDWLFMRDHMHDTIHLSEAAADTLQHTGNAGHLPSLMSPLKSTKSLPTIQVAAAPPAGNQLASHHTPHLSSKLQAELDACARLVEDLLYEAYSHFLQVCGYFISPISHALFHTVTFAEC